MNTARNAPILKLQEEKEGHIPLSVMIMAVENIIAVKKENMSLK
jgi:hypothetical protein